MTQKPKKLKVGFARMSKAEHRRVSAKGGAAVPAEKRSFAVDPQHAAKVGSKGGKQQTHKQRIFYRDRELAARAGRISAMKRKEK